MSAVTQNFLHLSDTSVFLKKPGSRIHMAPEPGSNFAWPFLVATYVKNLLANKKGSKFKLQLNLINKKMKNNIKLG